MNDLVESVLVHVVMVNSHVVLITSPFRHDAETKYIVRKCAD
jgi:hypothetical protein